MLASPRLTAASLPGYHLPEHLKARHGVAVAAAVWGKTWGEMANRPQYLALQGPGTDEEADQVANEGPASAADIYLNLRLDGVFQNLTNALCPGETQQLCGNSRLALLIAQHRLEARSARSTPRGGV
jgi:hypothetical protein